MLDLPFNFSNFMYVGQKKLKNLTLCPAKRILENLERLGFEHLRKSHFNFGRIQVVVDLLQLYNFGPHN